MKQITKKELSEIISTTFNTNIQKGFEFITINGVQINANRYETYQLEDGDFLYDFYHNSNYSATFRSYVMMYYSNIVRIEADFYEIIEG